MTQNKSLSDSAPAISVVMPVFNNEKYMEETIGYILNQTFGDFEYIIINDGSKDKSGEICEKYAQLDNRIKYVFRENRGIQKSINEGLDLAQGKYVQILDNDDIFDPQMLEKLYNRAEETGAEITMCNWRFMSGNGTLSEKVRHIEDLPIENVFNANDMLKNSQETNVFTTTTMYWAKLYKREFLEKFSIRFLENVKFKRVTDGIFVPLTIALADKITYIDDALLSYRIIDFDSKFDSDIDEIMEMAIEIKDQLTNHGLYSKFKQQVIDYLICGNLLPRFDYYSVKQIEYTFKNLPKIYSQLEITESDINATLIPLNYKPAFEKCDFYEYIEGCLRNKTEEKERMLDERNGQIEARDDIIVLLNRPSIRASIKMFLRYIKHRFFVKPQGNICENGKIRFVFTDSVLTADHSSGVFHNAQELLLGIDRYLDKNSDFEVYLATAAARTSRMNRYNLRNIKLFPIPISSQIMTSIGEVEKLRKMDRFIGNAIYFSPAFVTWHVGKKSKTISSVLDISFILPEVQKFNVASSGAMEELVNSTVKRANVLTSITENAAVEIEQHYKLPPKSVVLTKCAADNLHFSKRNADEITRVRRKYDISDKYFVMVSNIEPRKNHANLIKAMMMLPDGIKKEYQLVLVAAGGWQNEEVFGLIKHAQSESVQINVLGSGIVSDDELPAIYSGAFLTLFPSFYEGFGMSPLESMLCETPVALSNVSAMPEVAGDAGIYFNPNEPEEIRDAIMKVIAMDANEYNDLVKKGIAQANTFSWDEAVSNLMEAARKLAKE